MVTGRGVMTMVFVPVDPEWIASPGYTASTGYVPTFTGACTPTACRGAVVPSYVTPEPSVAPVAGSGNVQVAGFTVDCDVGYVALSPSVPPSRTVVVVAWATPSYTNVPPVAVVTDGRGRQIAMPAVAMAGP